MKSLLFLALVAFVLADPFLEHFKEASGLNKFQFVAPNKRAALLCPQKTTCNDIGGICTTSAGCTLCITNYTNCLIAAAGGANATCVCNQNYVSCYNANPGCYLYTPGAVTACLALPNCTCAAALAPPTVYSCLTDSYCNQVNATCVSLTTNGACTIGQQGCGDPVNLFAGNTYTCQTINGVSQCAKAVGIAAAGDNCFNATDCADKIACTAGVCVGTAVGGVCTVTASCAFGLWCNAGVCATVVPIGGACNIVNAGQCIGVSVCGFGAVCANLHSVADGGNCVQTAECAAASFCSVGGTKPGTCNPYPATPFPCYNNTDCTNSVYGGSCFCNPLNGNPVCSGSVNYANVATCQAQINASNTCYLNGQCKSQGNLGGTCFLNKCANLVACADNCVYNANQAFYAGALCFKYPALACAATGGPTGTTKAAASTLTFGAGLLLALLAFVF